MIPKEIAQKVIPLLRHDRHRSLALGCSVCPDRPVCGGLQAEAELFSCLDHCTCVDVNECDVVCPRYPEFAKRIHEVRGLSLLNIERRRPLSLPRLPDVIPLFYRSPKLASRLNCEFAVIPFSETYRRKGRIGFPLSRAELEAKFKFSGATKIILSGVENDRHVEQWWSSGGRKELLAGIGELGVIFATAPNFSVMLDVPRHDNLHAQKRIGLAWAELHDARIPTAFHINGITEQDFQNTREFLAIHDEIEAVSFEFTTGSANHEYGQFFTELLIDLAQTLGRPLTLVLRGGVQWFSLLNPHFARIVVIDTSSAMRTLNRRRASLIPGGHIKWHRNLTEAGAPLDELLAHNLSVMTAWLAIRRTQAGPAPAVRADEARTSKAERQADDKALQGSLL